MQDPTPLTPAETLSALADDQVHTLDAAALDRLLAAWDQDPSLAQAWRHTHWIGERLRSGEQGLPPASTGFAAGVMQRLAAEPPLPLQAPSLSPPATPAANDAVFRWKLVAGVATLAAAVAVVWQVSVGSPALSGGPQLAQAVQTPVVPEAPRVTAVVTQRGVLLRDPELDAFLAAHRQQGGVSALQMPAGFLRDATYESNAR